MELPMDTRNHEYVGCPQRHWVSGSERICDHLTSRGSSEPQRGPKHLPVTSVTSKFLVLPKNSEPQNLVLLEPF